MLYEQIPTNRSAGSIDVQRVREDKEAPVVIQTNFGNSLVKMYVGIKVATYGMSL